MLEDVMPWLAETVEAQRLEFCRFAVSESEVSFSELCRRFGISSKTGYKWLGRYLVGGSDGLADRSRAPKSSPFRTSAAMEALVCGVRKKHPKWGGRKIRRRLLDLGHTGVPAAATITGILRRHGLMEPAEPQAGGYTSFEAEAANDLWQMDHKGWFMTETGRCDPFDVIDDHSRFNLVLDASADQEELTVKGILTATFDTYGLPLWILCDNGSPWGNSQRGFRWTTLTVWLLDLGVKVTHSRPRHPQTLGKDERFHRTLKLEVISTRTVWDSHVQVQEAFDAWRVVYNHQRPHDALGGAVPATRYQPSPRSMPARIEPVDYPDGYQVRRVDSTARASFNGHRFKVGKAFRGRAVGILPTTDDGIYNVVYRHQTIRTLDLTQ
jgi:transposase InsO family protein